MTAIVILVAIGLASALVSYALWSMASHHRRWREEQPSWWGQPIDGPGLRQSVRSIDDAPAA